MRGFPSVSDSIFFAFWLCDKCITALHLRDHPVDRFDIWNEGRLPSSFLLRFSGLVFDLFWNLQFSNLVQNFLVISLAFASLIDSIIYLVTIITLIYCCWDGKSPLNFLNGRSQQRRDNLLANYKTDENKIVSGFLVIFACVCVICCVQESDSSFLRGFSRSSNRRVPLALNRQRGIVVCWRLPHLLGSKPRSLRVSFHRIV